MNKVFSVIAAFLLLFACTPGAQVSKCPEGAVDLGIVMTRADGTTYRLYWAKSNLSDKGLCANPEDYGDYYAWGETQTKADFSWSTYKFGTSESNPLSKYNATDRKTQLDPADDVAHVRLAGKRRMPTDAEWAALREKCTWTWTKQNGVKGDVVTAPNGNSIFLPAAGIRYETSAYNVGSNGDYWSSSLHTEAPKYARRLDFNSEAVGGGGDYICIGYSVRPVSE